MKKYIYIISLFFLSLFVSCNDFLDTLPDKRTELDSAEKIAQLLVSAYPTELPTMVFELMSDNVTDNGPRYGMYTSEQTIKQAYTYENMTEVDWDVPYRVWEDAYKAIAAVNQALDALDALEAKQGVTAVTKGIRSEALLCRAYNHFNLVNTFCIAYNPQSSETDLGIPYVTKVETTVIVNYDRGTVAKVYEQMNKDIEAALPLLQGVFQHPAYHFNNKAAYAFAAQFNLFYGKWEKTVQYATKAIGVDPTSQFRNMNYLKSLTMPLDITYAYISKDAQCNLLILPQRSLWGRIYKLPAQYSRYAHGRSKSNATYWQLFPWGRVPGYASVYGNDQCLFYPKSNEIFEISNATAGTGQPHTVMIPFTVEETLMFRAEANAMLNKFGDAVTDLNYWYAHYSDNGSTSTVDQISTHYATDGGAFNPRIKMDSRFNIAEGKQDHLVRAVLAARRIETVHNGRRWLDIKRHGITVEHPVFTTTSASTTIVLKPYENRTAVQIPQDVVIGGIPQNPSGNVKKFDESLVTNDIQTVHQ